MERQLDIFKSRRQKGVAPAGPSEFQIHCAVIDYFRHGRAKGWLVLHPANGGERPAVYRNGRRVSPEGGRLQRMGQKKGASDLLFAGPPNGQLHALELKRRNEKLSRDQETFFDEVRAAGGKVAWADNVDAALEILREWGAVRSNSTRQKV